MSWACHVAPDAAAALRAVAVEHQEVIYDKLDELADALAEHPPGSRKALQELAAPVTNGVVLILTLIADPSKPLLTLIAISPRMTVR